MARAIMAVFSNPTSPEVDEEFNRWYSDVHVKDLIARPGITSARRYKVSEAMHGAGAEHRYIALYEIEGSPDAVLGALGTGDNEISPTLDAAGSKVFIWHEIEGGPA